MGDAGCIARLEDDPFQVCVRNFDEDDDPNELVTRGRTFVKLLPQDLIIGCTYRRSVTMIPADDSLEGRLHLSIALSSKAEGEVCVDASPEVASRVRLCVLSAGLNCPFGSKWLALPVRVKFPENFVALCTRGMLISLEGGGGRI